MALYRTYRPRRFEDVVGQDAVVSALRTALGSGRLAHALLFDGGRGTGKTTLARMVAKGLNCERGPTGDPCGECDSCVAIDADRNQDVFELDAASHRGVDDARALRERLAMAPVGDRSMVFILDEAHMLTREAQNALLKSVEEPPAQVYFIFCTTEPHKLLDTIRSRCHRFHLQRPSIEQLSAALARVAAAEQIGIDDDAMALICRQADGSYRDALGLLEQVSLHADGTVHVEAVNALLGQPGTEQVLAILQAAGQGDQQAVLDGLASLQAGATAGVMADLLRALMYAHGTNAIPERLGVETRVHEQIMQMRAQWPMPSILGLLRDLDGLLQSAGRGLAAQLALEAALLRVTSGSGSPAPAPPRPIQTLASPAPASSDTPPPPTETAVAQPAEIETSWSVDQAARMFPLVRLALRTLVPEAYLVLRAATATSGSGAVILHGVKQDQAALEALSGVMHRYGSWPIVVAPATPHPPKPARPPAEAPPASPPEDDADLDDVLGAAGLVPLD